MSHRTQFAGLSAPDVGESPTQVQNGDFVYRNPDLIDQFLRIGAVTHRHDGHAALVSPSRGLTLALGSGGQLSPDTTYWMTYTTVDGVGGETTAAAPASAHTGSTIPDPTIAPSAGVSYASGIMPAGNYAYALTYTDGQGGETLLGPITWAYVAPGFASAQVILTNLDLELTTHGGQAVDYRLWRSYEGNDWHLVTELAGTTFVDDGFDPPDNPARPPGTNTTRGVNQRIFYTFPTIVQEPSLGPATAVRVYIGLDSTFASPALASAFGSGGSVAGQTFEIDVFAPTTGQPPAVSLSLPGANQINPDTDLVDWHWKRPVALISQLPASGNASGDARMVMTPLSIFAYTGAQWQPVAVASGIGGAAPGAATGSAGVFVAGLNGTAPTPFGRENYIEFGGSGGTSVSVTDLGGGSARVLISASGGPQGPPGPAGTGGGGGGGGASAASNWQSSLIASGGMVAFYRFNEGAAGMGGRPLDTSGNGHHGSAYVNAPFIRFGPGVVPLDSNDSCLDLNPQSGAAAQAVPDNPGYALLNTTDAASIYNLSQGSVECFFAWDLGASGNVTGEGENWAEVFSIGKDTNNYVMFTPAAGSSPFMPQAAMIVGGTSVTINAGGVLNPGWHHLVLTWDGATFIAYLDGVLMGQASTSNTMAGMAITAGNARPYVGKSQFNDPAFRGQVDELILWNRVLTQAEAAARVRWVMSGQAGAGAVPTVSGPTSSVGAQSSGGAASAYSDLVFGASASRQPPTVSVTALGGGSASVLIGVSSLASAWSDDFSTNDISSYGSNGTLAITGGVLTPTDTTLKVPYASGTVLTDFVSTVKVTPGASVSSSGQDISLTGRFKDSSNYIFAQAFAGNSTTDIQIFAKTNISAAIATLNSVTATGLKWQQGVPYWLRLVHKGAYVRVEIWTQDPVTAPAGAVPFAQVEGLLSNANLGSLPPGPAGLRWTPDSTSATLDDFKVDKLRLL